MQYRQWYLRVKADRDKPSTCIFCNVNIQEISPENSTVFVICHFSFYALLSDWWRNAEIPLSQTNSQGDNLLTLAATAGCRPICEALIKRGAQVNLPLQTGRYGSALTAAASQGNTETVKYLVEQGADVNLPLHTGQYGSALAAAAAAAVGGGDTKTVKYLVEHGADVKLPLQIGRYGSALAAAAYWGWKQCVDGLIDAGAKVDLRLENGPYSTALHASQADVSQEDRETAWWDSRGKERQKRDKAEVAELLQRKAQ